MDSIPRPTVIKVPLHKGFKPLEFTVSFTDAMIKLPSKGDNSGTRFITVCLMQSNLYTSSPWCGVAVLHPNDIHSQEIGNRLAFQRAVFNFCNSQPFRDGKNIWDLFRKALWEERVGKYMHPEYQK